MVSTRPRFCPHQYTRTQSPAHERCEHAHAHDYRLAELEVAEPPLGNVRGALQPVLASRRQRELPRIASPAPHSPTSAPQPERGTGSPAAAARGVCLPAVSPGEPEQIDAHDVKPASGCWPRTSSAAAGSGGSVPRRVRVTAWDVPPDATYAAVCAGHAGGISGRFKRESNDTYLCADGAGASGRFAGWGLPESWFYSASYAYACHAYAIAASILLFGTRCAILTTSTIPTTFYLFCFVALEIVVPVT